MTESPTMKCPRCSDCVGQSHHWMENFRVMDENDPYFICKHCDAACGEADPEEGFAEPSGVIVRQGPICEECDWYTKDCECEPNDGIDERGDDDGRERSCIDPAACCCPHPFHTSDECEFHDDDHTEQKGDQAS